MQTPPVLPTTTAEAALANSNFNDSGTVISESHSQLNDKTDKEVVEEIEVKFEEGDSANPLNWKRAYRWYITLLAGLLGINATFASSAPSGIVPEMIEYFGFSHEVGVLTIALFVGGYCVGPLVWGPVSENIGRKIPLIISFTAYTGFTIGCALSRNTASILIFRFLSGMFSASALVISGALMGDIWDPSTRGKALSVFTLAPFAGPSLGPTVSGFMAVSGVSWRWVYWVMTIFAGACLVLIIFTLPETFKPIILQTRAKQLRKDTGDNRYFAPIEKTRKPLKETAIGVVTKPFIVFASEPMLIALTLYMSFIYGVVYLLFEAYPIVFGFGHHFNAGISGLMFLPIPLGGLFAVLGYIYYWNPRYAKLCKEHAPNPVPPEARLHQAIIAAPIFAGAFFWFGWTSYPSVSFWAPMMAGGPLGFSIVWIFLGLFSYIIDTYLFVAASALAANTVMRSLFGAGFPLFATQMYDKLTPRWASTLLGFLALIMMPIPLVLYKFGPRLREKSKFAPKNRSGGHH
ncbi:hypothetical protein PHLGIDRAFT_38187 [Phlebiopsis gigantea 11061_1 CR5-6]|uniref:Major facilitator superfamily (MFS) profile domain-containing protein n=1 Tax=Phlebiopsis gigantea (strain 11061_1 CR5-6) TaxID=745531 RepID=A0A0C3RZC1_PHLG1|nr:hypothetical protein PHLGIDRAFT_38187 [Phlebiopsis gigantea 11061_1 CR5-6]